MIKNASELANVLGMAFSAYANKLQNGDTSTFNAFLEGKDTVTVTVQLVGDSIVVKPYVEREIVCTTVIEPTPVLEETAGNIDTVVDEEVKPKRKRNPT